MHLAHLGNNTADRSLRSRLHTRIPIIELCIVPGKRIECVLYGLRDAVKMVAALKRKQQPALTQFFCELFQSGLSFYRNRPALHPWCRADRLHRYHSRLKR